MNTLHLKYVVEIDKAGSISKAAENLYMGQPNLSKAVRELEESLDITIFKRTSKGVTPTDKGAQLIRHARSILSQVDELEALCKNKRSDAYSLNICGTSNQFMSYACTSFVGRLPKNEIVDLSFVQTSSTAAIDLITEGQSDLGLLQYPVSFEGYYLDYISYKDIIFETIWTYDEVLTAPARSPLAASEQIDPCDLGGFLEISYSETQMLQTNICQNGYQSDKLLNRRYVSVSDLHGQMELLKGHADAYMITSPMSEAWLKHHGLIQLPLKHAGIQQLLVLASRKVHPFSSLEKLLIREINHQIKQI